MENKSYHITTFGCQMNAHDSEKLAGILNRMGYIRADKPEHSGLVVFNTCCIRENAENRLVGNLGYMKHLKQTNKGMIVAVGGCMPQQGHAEEMLVKTGAVDIMFGTHNLHLFGELLQKRLATGKPVISVWDEPLDADFSYQDAVRESPWRSGVNIMYGCDNFCSYCVVPYVRGRERSREPRVILDEVQALLNDGVLEIMLLGQNVNSYRSGGTDFPGLLRRIAEMNVPRVRFMTSHPKDLSRELIQVIREFKNICKHIHLPVQSGSDSVLSAMNRRYTRRDYLELIDSLRAEIPEIMITTDIIVGFPGETERDFSDTLELVRKARYSGAFTFIYSPRKGTKAAEMENQVDADTTNERFARLLDVLNPIALEVNKMLEGRNERVLVESLAKGIYTGRTESNLPVHFPSSGEEDLTGKIADVYITEAKTFYLKGELAD